MSRFFWRKQKIGTAWLWYSCAFSSPLLEMMWSSEMKWTQPSSCCPRGECVCVCVVNWKQVKFNHMKIVGAWCDFCCCSFLVINTLIQEYILRVVDEFFFPVLVKLFFFYWNLLLLAKCEKTINFTCNMHAHAEIPYFRSRIFFHLLNCFRLIFDHSFGLLLRQYELQLFNGLYGLY